MDKAQELYEQGLYDSRVLLANETFAWPCHLTRAHGAHAVEEHVINPEEHLIRWCPGVKAHPATMIGRERNHA